MEATSSSAAPGTVYLLGAGPGEPELLTLKARRILEEADAVVYDHLVSVELLDWTRPGCERIFAGKKAGHFCRPQNEIEDILIGLAREGKCVARLKGGDPLVFGRGGEEAEALSKAGIPYQIVPGVTAALGAAAYSGIPLTHRAHSSAVVFLTGHEDSEKPGSTVHWEDYARLEATLCIYMGLKKLPMISTRLIGGGMAGSTPAAVIQSATTGEQKTLVATVETLALLASENGFESPALIIIGRVAALAPQLAWFESAHPCLVS